jgi:hypothetical protein
MKEKLKTEKGYNKLYGWYTCEECMCHHQGEHKCDIISNNEKSKRTIYKRREIIKSLTI